MEVNKFLVSIVKRYISNELQTWWREYLAYGSLL